MNSTIWRIESSRNVFTMEFKEKTLDVENLVENSKQMIKYIGEN